MKTIKVAVKIIIAAGLLGATWLGFVGYTVGNVFDWSSLGDGIIRGFGVGSLLGVMAALLPVIVVILL